MRSLTRARSARPCPPGGSRQQHCAHDLPGEGVSAPSFDGLPRARCRCARLQAPPPPVGALFSVARAAGPVPLSRAHCHKCAAVTVQQRSSRRRLLLNARALRQDNQGASLVATRNNCRRGAARRAGRTHGAHTHTHGLPFSLCPLPRPLSGRSRHRSARWTFWACTARGTHTRARQWRRGAHLRDDVGRRPALSAHDAVEQTLRHDNEQRDGQLRAWTAGLTPPYPTAPHRTTSAARERASGTCLREQLAREDHDGEPEAQRVPARAVPASAH